MSAFLYGLGLQWRLDLRSKTLLITCYLVPLLFYALMGGIFSAIMPEMKQTLIQSMIVMGVSMGALIGLPPSLVETYGSEIKKVYQANGVPICLGLITMFLSFFIHLMIMSTIIYLSAPLIFGAALPENTLLFFAALAVFTAVSLGVGCVLGLANKNQAKLTMYSQIVFLPSIMLSGIMFPITLLPKAVEIIGRLFPATWGFRLMTNEGFCFGNLWPMLAVLLLSAALCAFLLRKKANG